MTLSPKDGAGVAVSGPWDLLALCPPVTIGGFSASQALLIRLCCTLTPTPRRALPGLGAMMMSLVPVAKVRTSFRKLAQFCQKHQWLLDPVYPTMVPSNGPLDSLVPPSSLSTLTCPTAPVIDHTL